MKFSIATATNTAEFSETMQLIKSSLLYADEIELLGMAEYMIFQYLPQRIDAAHDIDQILRFVVPFLKISGDDDAKNLLQEIRKLSESIKPLEPVLKKKRMRTTQEILAQAKARQAVEQSRNLIIDEVEKNINSPGSLAIKELVDQNIVSIYDYDCLDIDLNELAGGYFGNLLNVMRRNTAYPLFDKLSESVIHTVVDTHILDIGRANKEVLRHAGVASSILMTLPTLNSASVDEILAFKKENTASLVNFRKAIYDFSERINALPWDDDFQFEILKLYSTEVAPKVEELNYLVTETNTLKNFGAQVIADEEMRKKAGWIIGGIAATVIAQSNFVEALDAFRNAILSVSLLAISPKLATGFLKTVDLFSKAKKEAKESRQKVAGNTMYYYYKAAKSLT